MTTKRLQSSVKQFERSMKKPKLDINVSKNRQNNSVPQTQCKFENFWDDDDDDVILLASQIVDSKTVTSCTENSKQKQDNNTFVEIHGNAATSTQKPLQTSKQKILTQLLDDDEGDVELLAVLENDDKTKDFVVASCEQAQSTLNSQKLNDNQKALGVELTEFTEFILSENSFPLATPLSTQNANSFDRRQLATERQMKFLMDKINNLKKENANLTKCLSENRTKMLSKTGECTVLRDELRQLQQKLKSYKMEKILHVETTKNQCQTKISELSKKVVAAETELRLQQYECSKIKTKYAEETQKLQHSISSADNTLITDASSNEIRNCYHIKDPQQYNKWLLKMRNLHVSLFTHSDNVMSLVPANFYELIEEKISSSKNQKTIFQLQLRNIQYLMAQLQLILANNSEIQSANCLIAKCIDSSHKVLPEFWSYCYSLDLTKKYGFSSYQTINEIDVIPSKSNISVKRLTNLLKSINLYENEKAISLRRYLGALTIMCKTIPNLATDLLESKHNDYYLLQIVSDALTKLSYTNHNSKHFGVIEAVAAFLHAIVVKISNNLNVSYVKLITDLLKQIIFSRPSNWVLFEVSSILLECSKKLPQVLDYVCINSSDLSFITDRATSNYRFNNDSCIIQVYSSLLGIAFPAISKVYLSQLHLLVDICHNQVNFAYDCFTKPVKFIQRNLHYYNIGVDDDKNENGSLNGELYIETEKFTHEENVSLRNKDAEITCKCYTRFCRSVVTLIFQTLRQWLLHGKQSCTNYVGKICRLGIHVLHIIFCESHSNHLMRDCEGILTHYLQSICQWLTLNLTQLEFNEVSEHFLKDLENSLVTSKYPVRSNMNNITVDIMEWNELFKFDDTALPVYTETEAKNCADNLILQDDIISFKFV